MTDQQDPRQPQDEQQSPGHSPVEEEFVENEPDSPALREAMTIFGYSLGVVLALIFVLFVLATVIVLLAT